MQVYEIPLSPIPQHFPITLGGIPLNLTVAWRNLGGAGWVIDLDDAANAPIVHGIPLVTGGDLLGQFRHLGLQGSLFVQTDGDVDAVPTFANLGVESKLLFVTQ